MSVDLMAARRRLMRRLYHRARRWGVDQYIEDMAQNAFVALYGLPVWERQDTDEWVDEFLVQHANADASITKAHKRERHILDVATQRLGHQHTTAASIAWESGRVWPKQEQYTEACQVCRVLPDLPVLDGKLVVLLAEGASPIECAAELGISLRDVFRRHKGLSMLVMRLLDDARDERAAA